MFMSIKFAKLDKVNRLPLARDMWFICHKLNMKDNMRIRS
jgi:hypothetical protein